MKQSMIFYGLANHPQGWQDLTDVRNFIHGDNTDN